MAADMADIAMVAAVAEIEAEALAPLILIEDTATHSEAHILILAYHIDHITFAFAVAEAQNKAVFEAVADQNMAVALAVELAAEDTRQASVAEDNLLASAEQDNQLAFALAFAEDKAADKAVVAVAAVAVDKQAVAVAAADTLAVAFA